MPLYFQDVMDSAAFKTFVSPYNKSSLMSVKADSFGSGEIALYARDYREMGRWIPTESSYVIGRYMFEVDGLPEAWVDHCNVLDEIWVPSNWQKQVFIQSGVDAAKIQVCVCSHVVNNLFYN